MIGKPLETLMIIAIKKFAQEHKGCSIDKCALSEGSPVSPTHFTNATFRIEYVDQDDIFQEVYYNVE